MANSRTAAVYGVTAKSASCGRHHIRSVVSAGGCRSSKPIVALLLAEVGADDVSGHVDEFANVVAAYGREDGFVYDDGYVSGSGKPGSARHHLERSVDGNRYNGQVEFCGERKCTAFEGGDFSGAGAGSFGEDYHRHVLRKLTLGIVHGASDAGGSGAVDIDVTGFIASVSDKGNFAERHFHHPFEIVSEPSVDCKDVVSALMVGHEDIRGAFRNIFVSFDRNGDERQPCHEAGPDDCRIVSPEPAAEENGAEAYDDGCQDSEDNHQGNHYDELVDTIEKKHDRKWDYIQNCEIIVNAEKSLRNS